MPSFWLSGSGEIDENKKTLKILLRCMVAYFCHHLSDNYVDLSDLYVVLSDLYVDLSDLYVVLSDLYVDLSDLYVDLSLIHLLENES